MDGMWGYKNLGVWILGQVGVGECLGLCVMGMFCFWGMHVTKNCWVP